MRLDAGASARGGIGTAALHFINWQERMYRSSITGISASFCLDRALFWYLERNVLGSSV